MVSVNLPVSAETKAFVAWNNEEVRQESPFGLIRDDEQVKRTFQQIVSEHANKFGGKQFSNFKPTTWFEEDLKGITHYVLKTVNLKANRRFVALDHISSKKEQTLDPEDPPSRQPMDFQSFHSREEPTKRSRLVNVDYIHFGAKRRHNPDSETAPLLLITFTRNHLYLE